MNAILNTGEKLLQKNSPHPKDQQGSPCCHNFLTVTTSYHSIVLFHVFKIAFPASHLKNMFNHCSAPQGMRPESEVEEIGSHGSCTASAKAAVRYTISCLTPASPPCNIATVSPPGRRGRLQQQFNKFFINKTKGQTHNLLGLYLDLC